MRFGLLLEDLDTFAGDIAARHAGLTGRVLLTASIDRISWLQDPTVGEVTMAHDLRMAGQVVWAGRSSMEVMIELSVREPATSTTTTTTTNNNNNNRANNNSTSTSTSRVTASGDTAGATAGGDVTRGSPSQPQPRHDPWTFVGVAFFVMVARTTDRTAAVDVPLLAVRTQRERELFEQGKLHMQQRQQRRDAHWARRPPSSEEVALVHELIRSHYATRAAPGHHSGHHAAAAVPMQRTALQSSCLMHSQDRNAWDVIFGGHLLRLAYEHAFATAALHAGEYCDPVSMDDVSFLMPVPIGTLLRLTGLVVFAEGPVVRVHVRATKLEPGAPEQSVVTNTFSFAFRCPSGPVRRVVPETMVEAMEYVMGHRQHHGDEASMAVVRQHQQQQQQEAGQGPDRRSGAVGAAPPPLSRL